MPRPSSIIDRRGRHDLWWVVRDAVRVGVVVVGVVGACPGGLDVTRAAAADAGAPSAGAPSVSSKSKAAPVGAKTSTFYYEDASGKQTMVVTFLPKRRIALKITRERKDGCQWSKELTARFSDVEDYGLPDGDDVDVDEYEVEPKQMTCRVFVDIEKDTRARADITTSECASACKLSGRTLMLLKTN